MTLPAKRRQNGPGASTTRAGWSGRPAMTTTTPDAEKAPDSKDESEDDVVDTPAAHIQTTATLREVDVLVDDVEGMARLTIRSTDISGSVFLEPEDACRIGDRLLTIGMENGDCNL